MKNIFKLLVSLLACALISLLFSCGARKVQKSSHKEETHSNVTDNSTIEKKSETNVKTTTTVNVDDKNETVTEETIYEPKDPAKESFVIEKDGTKTVLNNAKKTVKKTTQKNNTKSESKTDIKESQNNASKERKAVKEANTTKKENKSKEVDKKQFNPFVLIASIVGVLVLLCVIYLLYKKFMLP